VPDKAWKAWERRVAKLFGGIRRGADTRGEDGGKTDVIHDHWAIEVKLLGSPGYADLLAACKQAEENAKEGQEPVAVVKRKNKQDVDALVVQRLETFR
jgi:hypothetical protein